MNSTAAVLIIITMLTYGIVCTKKKMELLSAVAISFAVLSVGFGMLAAILSVCGSFSLNKTLVGLIVLSAAAALICRITGEKPKVMLKTVKGFIRPFFRDIFIMCMYVCTYMMVEYFSPKEDYVFMASKGFYDYLWLLFSIALVVLCAADICVHITGYIKAQELAERAFFVMAVILPVALTLTVFILAGLNSGFCGVVTALFLTVSVIAAGFGLAILYENRDFVELNFLAVSEMVLVYLLSSGILIGLNVFSVMRAAVFTAVFSLFLCAVIYRIKRRRPTVAIKWKKNLLGLVVCFILMPLSSSTFGMYGMGQDEGVYQAKAIGYLNGHNDNYMSFEEYEKCSEQDKGNYIRVLNDCLAGYNFAASKDAVSKASINDTLGTFHGVHTFSALLAANGTVFGLENMLSLGTWILILSVFLLWLILGNLKVKMLYKVLAVFLYILSPQIIWQAKTSLVETTLAFIVLSFIYLLTDKKHEQYRWLSFIPIVVFSFFHITIYVFMPLFVLIFYGMYFVTAKRRYIAGAVFSIIGYLAGFYMMYASSVTYVHGNYDRLYIGAVGPSNLKEFVTLVSAAGVIISLILCLIPLKKDKKKQVKKRTVNLLWTVFVWTAAIAGVCACFAVMKKSTYPTAYMTWYAYILSSGFVLFFAIAAAVFIRPLWFKENDSVVILSVMFYYCIIIYSAFFKKEVLHYYYYGRYIVPYVSIVVLLGAYMLGRFSEAAGRCNIFKDLFLAACTATVLAVSAIMLPYTAVPVTQQDQTQLQWKVLTEIAAMAEDENSAVLIEEEVIPQMMVSLKYMTGCDVYPLREEAYDAVEQCVELKEKYSHVYVVCTEYDLYDGVYMTEIYHKDNKIQMDVKMPERLSGIAALIPYAEEFVSDMWQVSVYEYQSEP